MSLKCKVGIHSWVYTPFPEKDMPLVRKCRLCGKVHWQLVHPEYTSWVDNDQYPLKRGAL